MKKIVFLCGSTVLFAADQVIKNYVEENMEKGQELDLIGSVVLRRVHNRGAAFNILSERPETVKILSLAGTLGLTVMQVAEMFMKGGFWKKKEIMLLTAGAWSNAWDRIYRGYVVDYVGFRCSKKKLSRITYNLGDFFIGAGSLILLVRILFSRK